MTPARLAVLASGGGSNLEAIARYLDAEGTKAPVRLAVVISNRASAPALEKARARGIPAVHLRNPSDSAELEGILKHHKIDLIALAGYLKLVPVQVVCAFAGKILNVHPALLPAHGGAGMYGLRVHQAVLDAGETLTGVTVHLVDNEYDHGAVLAQYAVPVLKTDAAATLAARVLQAEHAFYPRIICAFVAGTVSATHPLEDFEAKQYLWGKQIPQ